MICALDTRLQDPIQVVVPTEYWKVANHRLDLAKE